MHSRRTLLLEKDTWDITLDGLGHIALTRDEYATAQNVANEIRLFRNDAYFQQNQGIPHFAVELGSRVREATAVRAFIRNASLRVSDVAEIQSIRVDDFDSATRRLCGEITFKTVGGEARESIRTYF